MNILTAEKRLKSLLNNDKCEIVDIRSPVEFRNSNIARSVNLPLTNFANYLMKIKNDNKTLLVYGSASNIKDLEAASRYANELRIRAEFTTYETLTNLK